MGTPPSKRSHLEIRPESESGARRARMGSGPGRRHEDPDSGRTMPAAHGEIPPPFKSAAARSSRWTAWGRRRQRCGPIAARADRKAARVSSSAFLQAGDAIPPAQYTGTHQPPAHLRTPLLPIQPAAQSSMSRPALRPAIADTKSRCCELPPSSLSPTCRVESSVQRLSKFVRSIAATRRGTRAPLRLAAGLRPTQARLRQRPFQKLGALMVGHCRVFVVRSVTRSAWA